MVKIAVCGNGGCGKSHACKLISQFTTLKYHHSTSFELKQLIYRYCKNKYKTIDDCWHDRKNNRELWAKIIADYNKVDEVRLYREMIISHDILDGIRRPNELIACLKQGIVDISLWIERELTVDSSNLITKDDCDIIIINNGSLEAFEEKLSRFCDLLI